MPFTGSVNGQPGASTAQQPQQQPNGGGSAAGSNNANGEQIDYSVMHDKASRFIGT